MTIVHTQRNDDRRAWGIALETHGRHIPAHGVQEPGNGSPSGFGSNLTCFLPVDLAGLHGSAILSSFSHPQRVPSPYLRCHGRQVERIAPCRFRVPQFKLAHHIACKLADVPESHRSFSCAASSMDRTCTTRRPSNWVIQTIRSDRK